MIRHRSCKKLKLNDCCRRPLMGPVLSIIDVEEKFPFKMKRTFRSCGLPNVELKPEEVDAMMWQAVYGQREVLLWRCATDGDHIINFA